MTNLDSILKSKDITLPTKVHLVKAMVFPVVMYGCESWTIKKAEHWRTDFWTVVLEKTPVSPLDCKEIQQVHPKGDQSWCSLEGLMLRVKLQYLGHLTWRVDSLERPWCWEGLGAGGEGDARRWDGWMASLTRWTWVWVNSGSGDGEGGLACCDSWVRKDSDMTEQLNWTENLNNYQKIHIIWGKIFLKNNKKWCVFNISLQN